MAPGSCWPFSLITFLSANAYYCLFARLFSLCFPLTLTGWGRCLRMDGQAPEASVKESFSSPLLPCVCWRGIFGFLCLKLCKVLTLIHEVPWEDSGVIWCYIIISNTVLLLFILCCSEYSCVCASKKVGTYWNKIVVVTSSYWSYKVPQVTF